MLVLSSKGVDKNLEKVHISKAVQLESEYYEFATSAILKY